MSRLTGNCTICTIRIFNINLSDGFEMIWIRCLLVVAEKTPRSASWDFLSLWYKGQRPKPAWQTWVVHIPHHVRSARGGISLWDVKISVSSNDTSPGSSLWGVFKAADVKSEPVQVWCSERQRSGPNKRKKTKKLSLHFTHQWRRYWTITKQSYLSFHPVAVLGLLTILHGLQQQMD